MYQSVLREHVVSVFSAIDSPVLSRVDFRSHQQIRTRASRHACPCELQLLHRLFHLAQVRGPYTPPTGITMPTFMPETA